MRPLAVLSLLLGAIASLFFAFAMISDSSRGDGDGTRVSPGPVVRPNLPQGQAQESEDLLPVPVNATPLAQLEPATGSRNQIESSGAHIGFIRGKVQDPEGLPVEGAKVSLIRLAEGALWAGNGLSLTGDPASAKARATTVSDREGLFHLGNIEPGDNWGLSVSHVDFAPQVNGPILVPERGGKEELVMLERGNQIRGIVMDAELETPIENARLSLVNPMSAFLPSTRTKKGAESTVSDARGQFRFKNINGAQRTLIVEAEGYATQVLSDFNGAVTNPATWSDSGPGETEQQEGGMRVIHMLAGQEISGVVLAPDQSGVPGVRITAVNSIGNFGSRSEAISDAEGNFILKDLGPGAFSLTSEVKDYQTDSRQRVQAGTSGVVIQLIEFGGIAGTVTVEETGEPVSKFTCRVRNEHPSNPSWGVVIKRANFRSRADGSFEIKGIKAGRYVVEVLSSGYASSFSEPFAVVQGIETPDINIGVTKGSVILGRVVDAASGEPLAGVEVKSNDNNYIDNEFMKFLGGMGSSATSKKTAITDKDGNFKLETMTPDIYQIRVWKAGYTAIITNDINVRNVAEKTLPDFRLPRGAEVAGTVYDEQGAAVPGANVIMSPEDPAMYSDQLQVRADANGAFTFKNVRQGSYKLQSTRPQRPGSNPFAGAVDMQASMIQVDVSEGQSYTFDLSFKQSEKSGNKNF